MKGRQIKGVSLGLGSAEAGRSPQNIWAQFPLQVPPQARTGPAPPPDIPILIPLPAAHPRAGPGIRPGFPGSPGSPSSRLPPTQFPCSHSLGECRDGCAELPSSPAWGSSATRSSLHRAGSLTRGFLVPARELLLPRLAKLTPFPSALVHGAGCAGFELSLLHRDSWFEFSLRCPRMEVEGGAWNSIVSNPSSAS